MTYGGESHALQISHLYEYALPLDWTDLTLERRCELTSNY